MNEYRTDTQFIMVYKAQIDQMYLKWQIGYSNAIQVNFSFLFKET